MQCGRCGTVRQKTVQLGLQACPVRAFFRAGAEQQDVKAVYAAWHRCVRTMHSHCKATVPAAPAAAVPGEQLDLEAALVPVVPRAALLRPFRSHVCVRAGEAEFCMLCFTKAPRYRVAAWRQECCDGAAPIGSCPKHFLAAASVCRVSWPPRHEGRGASIDAAAKAWQDGHVLRQLRPPKRRVPAR